MLRFKLATTDSERKAIYRLRYQIYCIEKNYLRTDNYREKMEYDQWDAYSVHFMASTPTCIVGTARLIKDSPLGLPIEILFNVAAPKVRRKSYAEFSRLMISTEFRLINYQVAYGLYHALYRYSIENGITHWYAILDNRLHKLYLRTGFLFSQLGEPMECFGGITAPYCLSLAETMDNLKIKNPRLYNYLADNAREQATIQKDKALWL